MNLKLNMYERQNYNGIILRSTSVTTGTFFFLPSFFTLSFFTCLAEILFCLIETFPHLQLQQAHAETIPDVQ